MLTDMALMNATATGPALAEKLGQWLNLHDAITLRAVHTTGGSDTSPAPLSGNGQAIREALERVRTSLTNSIAQRALPDEQPAPTFESYRRIYLALQRDMASGIRPLRSQARGTLAQGSPALRRLAALDALFDDVLAERESRLLAQIPAMLQTRFEQLQAASRPAPEGETATDAAPGSHDTFDWQKRFDKEFQTVLRAELDLRLQPVLGLIEALNHETTPLQ